MSFTFHFTEREAFRMSAEEEIPDVQPSLYDYAYTLLLKYNSEAMVLGTGVAFLFAPHQGSWLDTLYQALWTVGPIVRYQTELGAQWFSRSASPRYQSKMPSGVGEIFRRNISSVVYGAFVTMVPFWLDEGFPTARLPLSLLPLTTLSKLTPEWMISYPISAGGNDLLRTGVLTAWWFAAWLACFVGLSGLIFRDLPRYLRNAWRKWQAAAQAMAQHRAKEAKEAK